MTTVGMVTDLHMSIIRHLFSIGLPLWSPVRKSCTMLSHHPPQPPPDKQPHLLPSARESTVSMKCHVIS